MSAFVLQLIACITMVIDHIGYLLLPTATAGTPLHWVLVACRLIGRLSFPLFAFGIVEGVRHTKNLPMYATRLLVLAVVSQVPFRLYRFGVAGFSAEAFLGNAEGIYRILRMSIGTMNIVFTLLLGLLAILAYESLRTLPVPANASPAGKKYAKVCYWVFGALAALAISYVTRKLPVEYGYRGVLLIVALYMVRNVKIGPLLVMALYVLSYRSLEPFYLCPFFAAVLMLFYNQTRGKKSRWMYLVYPLHLLLLTGVALLIH